MTKKRDTKSPASVLQRLRNARMDGQSVKREAIENLPLYPEERLTAHPTAEQVFRLFSLTQRQTLLCDGVPIKTFVDGLSPLQEQVLQLLGVPAKDYLKLD